MYNVKVMFRDFFKGIFRNLTAVFEKRNWPWHALMAASTLYLVQSGLDWRYFQATRGDLLRSLALPAAVLGFFVPIIVPVAMYIWGELKKNSYMMAAAATTAQAEILALVVSSTYKAFTGRIQPEFYTYTSSVDISRNFNFGFFQHGIFWGWPSSHAAVAFAGAVAMISMYKKSSVLHNFTAAYAIYIMVGVSVSIHWLSDALSGAILGAVVGFTVLRNLALSSK